MNLAEANLVMGQVKAKYQAAAKKRVKKLQAILRRQFPSVTWVCMTSRDGTYAVRCMHTDPPKARALWVDIHSRHMVVTTRHFTGPSWRDDQPSYRIYFNGRNKWERIRGVLIDEGIIHA